MSKSKAQFGRNFIRIRGLNSDIYSKLNVLGIAETARSAFTLVNWGLTVGLVFVLRNDGFFVLNCRILHLRMDPFRGLEAICGAGDGKVVMMNLRCDG